MSYYNRYRETRAKRLRRHKEGRCKGRFSEYIPYLLVHEVPSSGWSTRAWSEKMRRIIHVLSRLEYLYFRRLELSPCVIEFYEQFVLPIDVTLHIAADKGWKHPRDNRTGEDVPMTSDFVIHTIDGCMDVRTIKPAGKLTDERVEQKLTIERIYWEDFGGATSYKSVSEIQMSATLDANIAWFWKKRDESSLSSNALHHLETATTLIRALLLDQGATLSEAAAHIDSAFATIGVGTEILRHLLAAGKIPEADLGKRLRLDRDIPLLRNLRFDAA